MVTRHIELDDATVLALERHETHAHSIPSREVRDLGDALMLHDPRDRDPFWNRMVSLRWPTEPAAFDARLAEAVVLFGILQRSPHVWPSPIHSTPPDLVARLRAHGFADAGGGHVMVLRDPATVVSVRPTELPPATTLTAMTRASDAAAGDIEDVALVLAESFAAAPGRAAELAADMHRTLDDPRIALVLARVDGEPAAAAKATTFDGLTYVSSIGTRDAYRGRGLGGLVTRHAIVAGGGRASRMAYLGVFSGNGPAIRLYDRLGFRSIGEAPDLLLE